MTKPGHIRIEFNGVWFEYYELKKPKESDYYGLPFLEKHIKKDFKKYEASKRTVEVSNVAWRKSGEDRKYPYIHNIEEIPYIENNQPCIAKIENNKATIIKIS